MKLKLLFATVATAAAFSVPSLAGASTIETFDFTTTYNGGAFNGDTLSGTMMLDIGAGGVATDGTLTISGAGLPGTLTMNLALPNPPNSAYQADGGLQLTGGDNVFPITAGGLTFGTNAPPTVTGGYVLQFLLGGEFGECLGTTVCGAIGGPAFNDGSPHLFGPTTIAAAVPGPIVGAGLPGLILGFAGVGFMAYRRRNQTATLRVA